MVTVSGPGHSREYPAHAAGGHSGPPSPGPRLPVSPQGAALPESPVETEALPMRLAGPRHVWSCVLSMCCFGGGCGVRQEGWPGTKHKAVFTGVTSQTLSPTRTAGFCLPLNPPGTNFLSILSG